MFRPALAVTVAPEAKLIAKLLRAFVVSDREGDGLSRFEVFAVTKGDAL